MLKKRFLPWMLMLSGLPLLSACDREPRPVEVIASHGPGELALLIEREGGAGPYVEGTPERFRIVASGEAFKSVRWSTNAGVIASDVEQVTWTLPPAGTASLSVSVETESGKTAEGSFHFSVVASPLATSTGIDPGPDVTGSTCKLAFDDAGKGHAVYTNDTHKTLWYASWDGTSWKTEQIDGPGFNTGGMFITDPVLALDAATGTPHVAYLKSTGPVAVATFRIGYATRVNGAWIRESADLAPTTRMGIALNPAQGQQPVIVSANSNLGTVRVTTRTGANTWTSSLLPLTTSILTADPVFDATGALYLLTNQFASGVWGNYLRVIRGSAIESFKVKDGGSSGAWNSLVWGQGQHLLSMANGINDGDRVAIEDITVGTPLSASTVSASPVDYKYASSSLAYGGGKPAAVLRNGPAMELATPDAQGFWAYTQLGTVDEATRPSVAIRPTDGTPHVCYQRDGKVSFQ
ncbi:hypothetical protein D7X74_05805 [Corallococcus sp. CA047B]|uniref:hypothetical protein n=1 Tax=Corallococcus sp. CA047B TaxID=2316729 RepID=UPI000EA0F14B|nr:hypothetical protein [Corallococcus sp. CA047B]RKH19838.1 hypothetical protein D7X74_05805 [Corallococcus sp. CA047B]